MRDAELTYDYASQVSEKNPCVAPPLKVTDCSQITDGSAALVLVSENICRSTASINRSCRGCSATVADRLSRAGEKGCANIFHRPQSCGESLQHGELKPRDMNGVEVHDCFSITEICAYEILGLAETARAPSWRGVGRPPCRRCATKR